MLDLELTITSLAGRTHDTDADRLASAVDHFARRFLGAFLFVDVERELETPVVENRTIADVPPLRGLVHDTACIDAPSLLRIDLEEHVREGQETGDDRAITRRELALANLDEASGIDDAAEQVVGG